mmetsp:Transcript_21314/g.27528  ORF Transcript_21314/g.27528 Transcript_21314/m.27528 type:complete len:211 (+) Transcript_21314:68-700(+)
MICVRMLPVFTLQLLCALYVVALNSVSACAVGSCHILQPVSGFQKRQRLANMAAGGAFVARRGVARFPKPLVIFAGACLIDRVIRTQIRTGTMLRPLSATDDKERVEEASENSEGEGESISADKSSADEAMSTAMVASLGFYKQIISPLLPPACRFVPTCSQYGVQAIQDFGPSKGAILIAWRLLRCSPIGGKGYDPPRWPPVSYTHSSY